MADYWKSNPRKYCEACKCWFADDKASRDFHEGGRRHQANVKKQLETARARSSETSKEKINLEKTMQAIELAALNSFQQDVAGMTKKAKMPQSELSKQLAQTEQFLAAEQLTLEREKEKEKIKALAQEKMQEIQTRAAMEAVQKVVSAIAGDWQQSYSPEGYLYYYNNKTGVSQWEVPEDFQTVPDQAKTESTDAPSSPPTSSAVSSTTDGQTDNLKRSAEQADVEEPEVCPKRRGRAYGGTWTTVAEYDRHEPKETGTHEEEEEEEDLPTKKQEIHFEEKTLTGSLEPDEDGKVGASFKGFSFKKRNNKGMNKIRERTSHF